VDLVVEVEELLLVQADLVVQEELVEFLVVVEEVLVIL
jgi:hypothetical protein